MTVVAGTVEFVLSLSKQSEPFFSKLLNPALSTQPGATGEIRAEGCYFFSACAHGRCR